MIGVLYGAQPGASSFANNCLLARRLVEQGVRFVQLFDWGWDFHGTEKANGLTEIEVIANVTSRLIVNRTALKTRPEEIGGWINRFRAALTGAVAEPRSVAPEARGAAARSRA